KSSSACACRPIIACNPILFTQQNQRLAIKTRAETQHLVAGVFHRYRPFVERLTEPDIGPLAAKGSFVRDFSIRRPSNVRQLP
ncbi:hypothetical protein, partial [Sedimentitalea sp.]|uniref:hypothetical protein n=1 Tax=Sedimentitalea sp. TaxID=2048915 RepID=UPI003299461A